MPDNNGGANMNDAQFQNQIQEIIQSSYINSNKFYVHGAIACVYFLAAISTFLTGLAAFFESNVDTKSITTGTTTDSELKLDPFTVVLPIIVVIFDCDIRRVYRRKEKLSFIGLKLTFWSLFYAIIGVAAQSSTNISSFITHDRILRFSNYMFLIWPCIAVVYSYSLTKFPAITEPIDAGAGAAGGVGAGSEEQLQRFQEIMN